MGSQFGVRRPLRFLSHKLELSESQMKQVAKIISDLKTERAQAAVEERKTLAAFADAVATDSFNQESADNGANLRKESTGRVAGAVVEALAQLHSLLDADQRETLAYLLRTGQLAM